MPPGSKVLDEAAMQTKYMKKHRNRDLECDLSKTAASPSQGPGHARALISSLQAVRSEFACLKAKDSETMTSNLSNATSEQELDKAASTSGTVRLHLIPPCGRLPYLFIYARRL